MNLVARTTDFNGNKVDIKLDFKDGEYTAIIPAGHTFNGFSLVEYKDLPSAKYQITVTVCHDPNKASSKDEYFFEYEGHWYRRGDHVWPGIFCNKLIMGRQYIVTEVYSGRAKLESVDGKNYHCAHIPVIGRLGRMINGRVYFR